VSRLKHITHCLLLLSQADAGELPVGRERYDLSDDLKGLMDDDESLCETAGLAFEKHIEPGVCVEADRALMHQVFQNLVSNAVKHSLPNGSVRVRLGHDAHGVCFEIRNPSTEIPAKVTPWIRQLYEALNLTRRLDIKKPAPDEAARVKESNRNQSSPE
jgi:signal transduction histidine kinase